ncbi:unnamed protein product, partial [Rotaria sp. Silwood1]
MMIVRAAYDLTQGTELFLTYADILLQYEERTKCLDKHKFICTCTLCELDRAEPAAIRRKRKLLLDKYQEKYRFIMLEQINQNPKKAIGDMLKMVTNIENTYKESGREKYRLGLIEPLMALSVLELFSLYHRTSQMDKGQQLLKRLRQSLIVTPTGDDRIFLEENRQIFACLFGVW